MEYILWMAVVLPVIFSGGLLHCKMKEQKKKVWNLIPKCLSTWMMVYGNHRSRAVSSAGKR